MRRLLTCGALLVVLGAAPAVPTAAGAADARATPFERALVQEAHGRFRAALAGLEGVRLPAAQAAHRAVLRRAVAAFAALGVYHRRGQLAMQEAVLERLGRELNPVRDAQLRAEQQARLGRVRAARARTASFLGDVGHDLRGVAEGALTWLLVLGACALVAGLLWLGRYAYRARRGPQRGVAVRLEDLSADPAQRVEASRALGCELQATIAARHRRVVAPPEGELDVTPDLDGSLSVNMRVIGEEAISSGALGEASRVTLGPLAMNPGELAALLRMTFRRPLEHTLNGSLTRSGEMTSISVELVNGRSTIGWVSSATGSDVRAGLVAEVAEWIVFHVCEEQTSKSWPSICCYRQARRALSSTSGDRKDRLEQARRLLERSLQHDPANALARFELATVLRKLSFNRDAVMEYQNIVVHAQDGSLPPVIERGVAYSKALALSKIGTSDTHLAALEELDRLREDAQEDGALDPATRERLLELADSAWMATKVIELEGVTDTHEPERTRTEHESKLLGRLTSMYESIARERKREAGLDATHIQALAVARNALGRALYLLGQHEQAIELLEQAVHGAPDLSDAHLNLASALLRSSGRETDRDERIKWHLDRAREISPLDSKATYLCGKAAEQKGDSEAARRFFGEAADMGNSWAQSKLAKLAWDAGDRAGALQLAVRSVARTRATDKRARRLLDWTAQAQTDKSTAVGRKVLRSAQQAGRDITREARRRGERVPEGLEQQMAVIAYGLGAGGVPAAAAPGDAHQG